MTAPVATTEVTSPPPPRPFSTTPPTPTPSHTAKAPPSGRARPFHSPSTTTPPYVPEGGGGGPPGPSDGHARRGRGPPRTHPRLRQRRDVATAETWRPPPPPTRSVHDTPPPARRRTAHGGAVGAPLLIDPSGTEHTLGSWIFTAQRPGWGSRPGGPPRPPPAPPRRAPSPAGITAPGRAQPYIHSTRRPPARHATLGRDAPKRMRGYRVVGWDGVGCIGPPPQRGPPRRRRRGRRAGQRRPEAGTRAAAGGGSNKSRKKRRNPPPPPNVACHDYGHAPP